MLFQVTKLPHSKKIIILLSKNAEASLSGPVISFLHFFQSVTEKHWEEISTDASSDEEIKEKAKEGSSSLATKISKIEISSPGKRTKQSSLMSFFKKWYY